MSYRERSIIPVFVALFLAGLLVGMVIGSNFNDNFWQRKMVKEGKYHWVVDPETGVTNLVPK